MSSIVKRELVQGIAIIVAVIMFADFFLGWPVVKAGAATLQTWASVITNIALGLGVINILSSNSKQVMNRTKGTWPFSLWLIVLFAITFLLGLAGYISTGVAENNFTYNWLFNNVYVSLGQTLYAITAFYIFSAAYRSFKARTLDATVLLVAGLLVLLTNAPLGEAIWGGFPVMGRWLLDFGQVPSMRTFLIVGALGLLAYGFRALLGKEPGFFGEVRQ
jgi:hypothetical protein